MCPRTNLKTIMKFSPNGELSCPKRSNREKDKRYYRISAIVSRSKPKEQALSVERRATWLTRIRILQSLRRPFFYQVCNLVYSTVYKVNCSILAAVSQLAYLSVLTDRNVKNAQHHSRLDKKKRSQRISTFHLRFFFEIAHLHKQQLTYTLNDQRLQEM